MTSTRHPLRLASAVVQNGNAPGGSAIWLFDINNRLLRTVAAGAVYPSESYEVYSVRLMPMGVVWVFPNLFPASAPPQAINLNPGSVIVFTQTQQHTISASTIINGQRTTFNLLPGIPAGLTADAVFANNIDFAVAAAALDAQADPYLDKVLSLARLHASQGSTRDQFNAALKEQNLEDTLVTKKLSKPQFDLVQNCNQGVRLVGTDAADTDQEIADDTGMLQSYINTRLCAAALAAHPDQWDISVPDNQIKMINSSANGLFNYFYTKMGAYTTSSSLSTTQTTNSYNTTTIKLDAMVDIFKSLALPGDKLAELTGAVNSFVESMSTLSSSSSDKGLHNAKVTNFVSIQPPTDEPTLAKVAKMRMFYLQFNETTHEWSNSCDSGSTYSLDISIFALDAEINRQICHLMYDHNKTFVVGIIDADDSVQITNAGTPVDDGGSNVSIQTDKTSSASLGPAMPT